MQTAKFTSQDQCEYVYRESHYARRSAFHEIRRKLKSLKIYIIIMIISVGGGACAVWLPDLLQRAESNTDQTNPLDMLDNMENKEKLMEMYKKQLGKQ